MKYLINYADKKYYKSQKLNTRTGYSIAHFDKIIEYNKKSIDSDFVNKNKYIINSLRGAGYWLWKPYIIYKTLMIMKDGDYLFYCDAGSFFIKDINHLIDEMNKHNQVIMGVGMVADRMTMK